MSELEINKEIAHVNVLQAKDILEDEYNYYILMQLCNGGSLLNKMINTKLSEKDVVNVIEQLL